jgi:dsDNA-specific endonuclease/ATPase MutS2
MSVFRYSIKKHGDAMAKKDTVKPSMIESYPPELSQELGVIGLSYEEAFNVLKKK